MYQEANSLLRRVTGSIFIGNGKKGYPVLADVGEKGGERLEGECYEEYEDGKVL